MYLCLAHHSSTVVVVRVTIYLFFYLTVVYAMYIMMIVLPIRLRACEFFRCFGDNLLALYSIHLTLSQAFATCQIPKIEFGIGPKCNEIDGRMREVQGS